MIDQDKLNAVLEKQPDVLYRVLNSLNFHEAEEANKEKYKLQYAQIIFDLYIGLGSIDIPEETKDIISEIIVYIEATKTEIEEIDDIKEASMHRLYATANSLDWVCECLLQYEVENLVTDLRLEYEFIYELHQQGFDFPSDPLFLASIFEQWLLLQMSL